MDSGLNFYAGGIHFRMTFGFFAVWALLLLQSAFSETAAMAAVCIALHELGHIGAMRALGIKVRGITFYSGGIKLKSDPLSLRSTLSEMAVLGAGPLVNLLLGAAGCLFGSRIFTGINISLMLFNLLPLSALDGGRIMQAAAERLCPMKDVSSAFRTADILLGISAAVFFFMSGSVSFTLPLTMGVIVLESLGEIER
ncbi:MAG: metalloprotease [Huintestinicola sp.]|uniref:metalloprotease n=1 Tax=Huintestinicola sp. TaxID=2981661 RepID=UPI003F06937C